MVVFRGSIGGSEWEVDGSLQDAPVGQARLIRSTRYLNRASTGPLDAGLSLDEGRAVRLRSRGQLRRDSTPAPHREVALDLWSIEVAGVFEQRWAGKNLGPPTAS